MNSPAAHAMQFGLPADTTLVIETAMPLPKACPLPDLPVAIVPDTKTGSSAERLLPSHLPLGGIGGQSIF